MKTKKLLLVVAIVAVFVVAFTAIIGYAIQVNQKETELPVEDQEQFPESAKEFFESEKLLIKYSENAAIFEGNHSGNLIKYNGNSYKICGIRENRIAYRILNREESLKLLSYDDIEEISLEEAYWLRDMISSQVEQSELSYDCLEMNSVYGCDVKFYYVGEKVIAIVWGAELGSKHQSRIISYNKTDIDDENLIIPEIGEEINLFYDTENSKDQYLDTLVKVVEDAGGVPLSERNQKGSALYNEAILSGYWK